MPAGVYKPHAAADLDIDISAVTIAGAGAGNTIVDGQQLDRVFDVLGTAPSSIKVVVQGLTVRNGNAADPAAASWSATPTWWSATRPSPGIGPSGSGAGISNAAFPGTGNVTLVRSLVSRNV